MPDDTAMVRLMERLGAAWERKQNRIQSHWECASCINMDKFING